MPYTDLAPLVLVDVSNVAFGQSNTGPARLRNVKTVFGMLREAGVKFVPWTDASLHWKIDDPEGLEGLFEGPLGMNYFQMTQTAKGTEADTTIIAIARSYLDGGRPVYVLTCDKYRDHPRATGIARITFIVQPDGSIKLSPPLSGLLSRRAYLEKYPLLILPEGAPRPHHETRSIKVEGQVRCRCELCGAVMDPYEQEFDEDEPEESDSGADIVESEKDDLEE